MQLNARHLLFPNKIFCSSDKQLLHIRPNNETDIMTVVQSKNRCLIDDCNPNDYLKVGKLEKYKIVSQGVDGVDPRHDFQ
jgi:hypothetical protein